MNMDYFKNALEELVKRKNLFCVISIEPFGEYEMHDIQTNSVWKKNPYEGYAIVPADMVEDIMNTRGFCDIVLNDEGTEVVSFTAREIPDIPEPEPEPDAPTDEGEIWEELDKAYQEGVDSV